MFLIQTKTVMTNTGSSDSLSDLLTLKGHNDLISSLSHGFFGITCHRLYLSHSLFVKQDGDDDADDEDHGQDGSDHPDQTVAGVEGLGV